MLKIKTDIFKLQEYRIRKGFGCPKLAAEVGISRQAMKDIEKGRFNPKPETAQKIVDVLGIKFDDVFSIEGD